MVIAPGTPAWEMIFASCSWKRAFRTWKVGLPPFSVSPSLALVAEFEIALAEAFLLEAFGKLLGLLDRRGADEDRLPLGVGFLDDREDRLVFLFLRPVDLIVLVLAHDLPVGRDRDDVEAVDVHELFRLGERGARHAGELVVHAEIVLERDRRDGLVLRLDWLAFLRLQRLVQALAVAAARHHAAGELVDDDHLTILDDVVLVALEQLVRAQRLLEVVDDGDVLHVVQRVALEELGIAEKLLELLVARLGEGGRAHLLVDLVVVRLQPRHERVDRVVELGAVFERAGDDERRARLVDQDRVHLVDDREIVAALGHRLDVVLEVVAQVVEAEFVVGAVGDVGGVGGLALDVGLAVDDDADFHAEEVVDLPHPAGVALGEIVVDGDDVDALAGERVEVDGQRRHQRLALAGLHLGDAAVVEDHAADELNVEVTLAEGALGRLADGGESRDEKIVERLAVRKFCAEEGGLRLQLLIIKLLKFRFSSVDCIHAAAVALHAAVVRRAEKAFGQGAEHPRSLRTGAARGPCRMR